MKIDIAYIVSHGFAARMVMQTNLLGKLVKKGMSVALIAPDKEDVNLKKYCLENYIQLYQFNPESSFWSNNYAGSRMYFLENIPKNPALYEKYIYSIKYSKKTSLTARLKTHILKLNHDLKEYFPFIKSVFKNRELKMLMSREADDLIQKINPAIIVSTYPVNYSEAMLVYAAERKGVKSVMHLLSWDNISCKGHFPILTEEYLVWGKIMKDELQEYYKVEDSKIHVTGVPHFDLHIDSKKGNWHSKYINELGLDSEKPYLFFGMSSPRFAPKEIDIVETLAAQIENNVFGDDLQFVIRPHPQNIRGNLSDESWLPRLKRLNSKRVGVDFPRIAESKMPWSMEKDDMYKLSNLLAGAMLCMNSGSTLSIDSMMCGTPVILTSFDGNADLEYWKSARRLIDYNHLKKLSSIQGVITTDSYASLESSIRDVLNRRTEYSKTVSLSVEQFCSTSGQATDDAVEVLRNILPHKKAIEQLPK